MYLLQPGVEVRWFVFNLTRAEAGALADALILRGKSVADVRWLVSDTSLRWGIALCQSA